MPKVYCCKEFSFEACHHLLNYPGDCAKPHGHSYKLQVTLSGNVVPNQEYALDNMVMDFKELKSIVQAEVICTHDHEDLNNIYYNPTAEVMVIYIFHKILPHLPADVVLESVKLWETANSFAEFKGEI